MKPIFPYLTIRNLGKLFSRAKLTLSSPRLVWNPEPDDPNIRIELDLADLNSGYFDKVVGLTMGSVKVPCAFVCDSRAQVIWQSADRSFDLSTVAGDIAKHLADSTGDDIPAINRMVAYPKHVKTDPRDGVVRFAALAPIRHGERLLGAVCVVDDNDRRLTPSIRRQLHDVTALIIQELWLQTANQNYREEQDAVAFIQEVMQKRSGEAFLGLLAKTLSEQLATEWVFIAQASQNPKHPARTLAVSFQGASVANFDYPIVGSPFAGFVGSKSHVFKSKARELFPKDETFKKSEIEGFGGISLVNTAGRLGGFIVLMDRKPIAKPHIVEAVLKTVASRVMSEIEKLSQKQQSEQALSASQVRFQTLFESGQSGAALLDKNGTPVETNRQIRECLGFTEMELKSLTVRALCHPEDADLRSAIESCLGGDSPEASFEGRFVGKDERELRLKGTLRPVHKPDNTVDYFILVLDETGGLRRTESELNAMQSRLDILFQTSPVAIGRIDSNGQLLETNEAFRKLTGYGAQELENKTLADLSHGEDESKDGPLLEECRQGNRRFFQITKQIAHKTGARIWTYLSVSFPGEPFASHPGFALLEDRTGVYDLTSALESGKRLDAAFLESSPTAVALLDAQGHIQSANPAASALFRESQDSLSGRQLIQFVDPLDADGVIGAFTDLVKGVRSRFQSEIRFQGGEDGDFVLCRLTLAAVMDAQANLERIVALVEELTELRATEKKLSDCQTGLECAENKIHALFKTSALPIAFLNRAGGVTQWNRAFEALVQSTGEEIESKPLTGFLHPEDRASADGPLAEFLKSPGDGYEVEKRLRSSGDRETWARLQFNRIEEVAGDAGECAVVTFEDVTKRIESEKALAATDEPFQKLLQRSGVGLAFVRKTGKLSQVNEALVELLGYGKKTLQAKPFVSLFEKENSGEFLSAHECCLARETDFYGVEVPCQRKDGSSLWVALDVLAIRGETPGDDYLVAVFRDISEDVRLRQSLSERQTQLDSILAHPTLPIVLSDGSGQWLRANSANCRLFGVSESDVRFKSWSDFIHRDDRETEIEKFRQLQKGEIQHYETEKRLLLADGQELPAKLIFHCISDPDAGAKTVLGLVQDLSPIRELETALDSQQERFQALFEASTVGMALLDQNGVVAEANPSFCRFLEFPETVLKQRTVESLVSAGERKTVRDQFEECREGKRTRFQIETGFESSNHRSLRGRLTIVRIGTEEVANRSILLLIEDLTEFRNTEEQLKLHRSKLSDAEQTIRERDGEIAEVNARAEHFEELLGTTQKRLDSTGDDLAATQQTLAQREEQIASLDKTLQAKEENIGNLSQERDGLQERSSRLEDQITSLESTVQDKETRMDSMHQELGSQKERNTRFELQVETLEGKIRDLEEQLEKERRQLSSSETANSGLEEEIQSLREAGRVKDSGMESAQSELTSARSENSELHGQIRSLEETRAANEQHIEQTNKQLQTLTEANEKLQGDLDVLRKSEESKDSRIATANRELGSIRERSDRLQDELETVKESLRGKEEQIHGIRSQFDSAKEANEKLLRELEQLRNQVREENEGEQKLEVRVEEGSKDSGTQTEQSAAGEGKSQRPAASDSTEDRLGPFFEQSRIAMVYLDGEGRIIKSNAAFCDLLGYADDRLLSKTLAQFGHPEDEEHEKAALTSCFAAGRPTCQFDKCFLKESGEPVWIHASGTMIPNGYGNPEKLLLIFEDITARVDFQARLSESEDRFQAIAESSTIGVFAMDSEGRFAFCNVAFANLLESTQDGVASRSLLDFTHPDDPNSDVELDRQLIEGAFDDYQVEKYLVTANGSPRWVRMSVRALRTSGGEFWYSIRTVEDLTAHRQATDHLVVTQGRFQVLFDHDDYGLALLDAKGSIVEANEKLYEMTGKEPNSLEGVAFAELAHSQAKESLKNLLRKIVERRSNRVQIEEDFQGKDGKAFKGRLCIGSVFNQQRQLESAIAVLRDVSVETSTDSAEAFFQTETKPAIPLQAPKDPAEDLRSTVKISQTQKLKSSYRMVPKPASMRKEQLKRMNLDAIAESSKEEEPEGGETSPHAEATEDAFITVDAEGRVILLNQKAQTFLQRRCEDCLGKNITEIFNALDQKPRRQIGSAKTPLKTNLTLMETAVRLPDGKNKTALQTSKPLIDSKGDIAGTILLFRPVEDIHEIFEDERIRPGSHTNDILNLFAERTEKINSLVLGFVSEIDEGAAEVSPEARVNRVSQISRELEKNLYE